tara:strand:+ start:292 stop:1260 length:969 start_codon:yes stop_codon:yes gene_type:complete
VKIVFWGTPDYSVRSLEAINNSKHELVAVITQPDKKRSRGNKLIPSPVKEYAINNNIPVISPNQIKNNEYFLNQLKEMMPDLFIVIAYGKILSKEILNIPKYGSWNAHASLLPKWRGAAPIQRALLSGDKYTGVGIMKMEEGLDTGDILIEEKMVIEENENLKTLMRKLSELSSKLIIKSIDLLNNKNNISELNLLNQLGLKREIKYAKMITKSEYLLNLDDTAENIQRKVNGLFPGAYIIFNNKNLKILKIKILSKDYLNFKKRENHKTKEILGIIKNEGIIISTKTFPILLLEVKLEGKNITNKNNLIQQLNTKIGDRLT